MCVVWGEVGKTTIMKHVYNQLIEDSVFDSAIWVTVSRDCTLEELQNNILKCLGISLPLHVDEIRGSMEVYSALKRRKKFVLILDDMDRTDSMLKTLGFHDQIKKMGVSWR